MRELFGQPYGESDPYWVVKGYFDRMYSDGCFLEAVGYIAKRWGFGTDGAYCNFPDMSSLLVKSILMGLSFPMDIPLETKARLL